MKKKQTHPKNCKGCPDCPATYTCKCGKTFTTLNTTHKCKTQQTKKTWQQKFIQWYEKQHPITQTLLIPILIITIIITILETLFETWGI